MISAPHQGALLEQVSDALSLGRVVLHFSQHAPLCRFGHGVVVINLLSQLLRCVLPIAAAVSVASHAKRALPAERRKLINDGFSLLVTRLTLSSQFGLLLGLALLLGLLGKPGLIVLCHLFHRIRKAVNCSVSASKREVSLSTAAAFLWSL